MAKRRAARRADAEGESSPRLDTHAASTEPETSDVGAGPPTTDDLDQEIALAVVGPDPRDHARLRRLEACGLEADRCPVLDLELDPSPRADAGHRPILVDGAWMSARAAEVLAMDPTIAELEHVVAWLRDRERDQEEP